MRRQISSKSNTCLEGVAVNAAGFIGPTGAMGRVARGASGIMTETAIRQATPDLADNHNSRKRSPVRIYP